MSRVAGASYLAGACLRAKADVIIDSRDFARPAVIRPPAGR
jgi:hypothetical protein